MRASLKTKTMKINDAIVKLRKEKKLKQYQLAKLSELTKEYLSDIETGKKEPSKVALEKICSALGVSLPYIYVYSLEEKDVKPGQEKQLELIKGFALDLLNVLKPEK